MPSCADPLVAYLLTTASFTLFFGRLYTHFNLKLIYLCAIGVFEIGSLICGVAPNSVAFIVGRAIAGLGSAGLFSGALLIIAHSTPLVKRAAYTGIMSSMYGVASVCGPLIGGAFTDHVTWRWCFYINLPIGGVAMAFILFCFKSPPPPGKKDNLSSFKAVAGELDILGTIFFIPSVVCLLLALQFGGSQYAWSDGRIITYFVVFGVCLLIWLGIQFWKPERASINPSLLAQRTVASCSWFAFSIGASFYTLLYYLPIWFQAIKGVSALQSGIDNIPLFLAVVIATIASGILVTVIGHYVPFMIASTILLSIGNGLITTFKPNTGSPEWIGYQVITGFGIGLGMQQALVAAQVVVSMDKIPTVMAMLVFFQSFGAALFVSVGQSVFQNKLISDLAKSVPDLNPVSIIAGGATTIRSAVPAQQLPLVLDAYNDAVRQTFIVALAMGCLTVFGVIAIEWKSVKNKQLAMG